MFMDPGIRELSGMMSGFNFWDAMFNQGGTNTSKTDDLNNQVDQIAYHDNMYHQHDSPEGSDVFSDVALTYISKMLMEEDMDDKIFISPEGAALQAAEKPFYDILNEKYPPSQIQVSDFSVSRYPISSSSFSSTTSNSLVMEDLLVESQPARQFRRGLEEASKFLPHQPKIIQTDTNPLSKNRKNPYQEDLYLEEGRSIKQSAIFSEEEEVETEMFDMVLLCNAEKPNDAINSLREALQNEVSKNTAQSKTSNGSKSRGNRRQLKKEVIDLRTLLVHCAQSVAADDRNSAGELLKQIRQHSSPLGDGTQRLAHCFADGLEARLAGTGSQIYNALMAKRQSAAAILKAYHLFLAACPFKRVSHFFANQTILNAAEKAKKLHIVDFGIYFGFQWPSLIQWLSSRPGGPPKLRITGIDVPQPGFRPNERIEETGRRLKDYAKKFNVDLEYLPISSKWESIKVEDLKIEEDELLVVNCMYRFRNLIDETVVVDSPRNIVLNKIRKMNPSVFIHAVVNGSFSAPFFVTRFREALFHFSALFDMLDATVPRDHPERFLIEKEMFGREAMNVIACEGSERVERPETYKQWQVRNLRAGFTQLPLNKEIMNRCRDKVRSVYDKDFVIDEDSRWLLQGWKGRIIYAISTWKPDPSVP